MGNKIKIAVISTNYPSKKINKFMFVHVRVKEYLRKGFEVEVFTKKELSLDAYTYENVKVNCGSILKTRKKIIEFNPDLIIDHAPNPKFSSYLHPLLHKRFKIISWLHGNEVMRWVENENKILSIGKIIINSICLRFDTKQVAVSKWMKNVAVKECFLPSDKIEVIPNLVDSDKFSFYKRDFENKKMKIISLRDLDKKYGIDIGINALNDINIPFEWDVFGIGHEKGYADYLENLVKNENININRKRFPHDEIPKLYSGYDIFLAPSRHEAQGVAMVEAMMTGMPVITSNIGGIPEFVNKKCGFMSSLDSAKIKENLIKFYKLSNQEKVKMSFEARKKAIETSSYDKTIKKEINLFIKVVKK